MLRDLIEARRGHEEVGEWMEGEKETKVVTGGKVTETKRGTKDEWLRWGSVVCPIVQLINETAELLKEMQVEVNSHRTF